MRVDKPGGGQGRTRPAATGRSPCAHTWRRMPAPRGAEGQPDGELAPAVDDSLGHHAEDAEADEHEPAPDDDARREDVLGITPRRDAGACHCTGGFYTARPVRLQDVLRDIVIDPPPRSCAGSGTR